MSAEVVVVKDVAEEARVRVIAALKDAISSRGTASLALSGGSTPEQLYALLAKDDGGVDWSRVDVFFGDERCVPPDHASSNYRMATNAWLGQGKVPSSRVHRMQGEAGDLDAEAARYQRLIEEKLGADPVIDVVLLGMGADGHTASMFPGTPAAKEDKRRVVALHAGAPEHKRLTMTAPLLLSSRLAMLLLTGASKAEVIWRALHGPLDVVAMPVQHAVRQHPNTLILCDAAAAARVAPGKG